MTARERCTVEAHLFIVSLFICPGLEAFFIFIFLKIVFYRNIFSVSQFTGLYPYRPSGGGRGPTACLRGGRPPAGCRGLYVIKICVLSHGGPYRPAGGRQAPPNIKAEVPPPHLHLQQTISTEGKRRDLV